MKRTAQIGDRVVRLGIMNTVFDLTITRRTEKTIATVITGSTSRMDERMDPHHFRFYDEAKVNRMEELKQHIKELEADAVEIYQSLDEVI